MVMIPIRIIPVVLSVMVTVVVVMIARVVLSVMTVLPMIRIAMTASSLRAGLTALSSSNYGGEKRKRKN
jgi:hypothetical protein